MNRSTYLYVISSGSGDFTDNGPIKVGVSDTPVSRLYSLQCGNPNRLSLHNVFEFSSRGDALDAEKLVHEQLSECRLCGEWFDAPTIEALDVLIQERPFLEYAMKVVSRNADGSYRYD